MCRLVCVVLFLGVIGLVMAEEAADKPPGLSVRRPFQGIGINYFSLASRLLSNPKDSTSLTNLSALAKAKIPFVRFMCGSFWPSEQRLYLTNREAYFERLDRVIRSAELAHIGLIPSFFWHLPTIPDLVGEPMRELGNTNSRSIALIRNYTKEVVSRYRGSPAIWAWEFGNEATLGVDLPNAAEHRPPVVPQLGTSERRTELDELRFSDLRVAYVEFASSARSLDPQRLILSGNSLPRPSAWHNTHQHNWTADTEVQFREILWRDNPDPMNGISVHVYPSEKLPAGEKSIAATLMQVVQQAGVAGKPVFVGEFGISRRAGSIEEQKRQFGDLLAAIENAHIPLAAAWVFDYPGQDQDWNISFQNDRSIFLNMMAETNQRLWKR